MIDAHEIPEAIQWHEGMLLGPQQFQQSSIRQEELLHYHSAMISPFHWGIRRSKVDPGLLVNGMFRVLDLEAVMPDGLIVTLGGEEDRALELNLADHAAEAGPEGVLTISLAVPTKKFRTPSTVEGFVRYYSAEGRPVVDENTGEGEMIVPRLRPALELLVGDTVPKRYDAFPLAKVSCQNETFVMTDFIPPTLRVAVDSQIGEICSSIGQRLREKATFLSEKVRVSSYSLEMNQIIETRGQIQNLTAGLPHFETVLNTGRAHPFALYLSLCMVAGYVSGISASMIPPVLTPYNHNDLRFSFEQIRQYLFRVIDERIVEKYIGIPFIYEEGIFRLLFQEPWLTLPLVIGARGRHGQSEEEVDAWMKECLIGSESKVPAMWDKRILGAERTRMEEADEIYAAKDMLFYSLKVDPQFIVADENLQVMNTGDLAGMRRPAEMFLYVRNVD